MKDKAPLEGVEYDYSEAAMETAEGEPDWLQIARSAWDSSTDFLKRNHKMQMEKNLDHFMSRHPSGSKYRLEAYKNRSKLFRPKTRIAVRKNEANFAAAMFSADDVVVIEAEKEDDAAKRRDAHFWHEVINYRLTKTIPWFMLSIGAFQEAQVYGVVVSKQYWDYEEEVSGEEQANINGMPVFDNDTGEPIIVPITDIKRNEPKVRLVAMENFRFDAASDWTDPVTTSPYLIEAMPMFVCDVEARMVAEDPKTGQPEWKELSRKEILSHGKLFDSKEDSTKKRREAGRDNEADHTVGDFETVYVLENIVRYDGHDWLYYTMGTGKLLSDPVLVEEVYKQGRPYVRGVCVIEAHRPIPSGTVQLFDQLQAEANDTVNQRLDNVKLALNRRKRVNRNANVDLHSLMKDVPGGIVLTDDMDAIQNEDVQDVTSSAYMEQNRVDADFDDIAGVFSNASVQTNRSLNETVGGMELMSQFANKESEYLIRTFVETWVEPVLRQLCVIEQEYEDNPEVIDMATENVIKKEKKLAKQQSALAEGSGGSPTPPIPPMPSPTPQDLPQAPQQDIQPDFPLEKPQTVAVRVNVGFGNLNPDQRIAKVMKGIQVMAALAPWLGPKLDAEEVAKEIFGALGHKNGSRFYTDFEMPQGDGGATAQELKLKQMELQHRAQYDEAKLSMEYELGMAKIAAQKDLTVAQMEAKVGIDREKIASTEKVKGLEGLTKTAEIERKENELAFKERTGRQGI